MVCSVNHLRMTKSPTSSRTSRTAAWRLPRCSFVEATSTSATSLGHSNTCPMNAHKSSKMLGTTRTPTGWSVGCKRARTGSQCSAHAQRQERYLVLLVPEAHSPEVVWRESWIGTDFGHMELDEFKSKSLEEMARIKALCNSTKQQNNKKQHISSVDSSLGALVANSARTSTLTIGGQNISFTVAAATTST